MTTFQMYLQLGIEHITDLKGYDHILFLITLIDRKSTRLNSSHRL